MHNYSKIVFVILLFLVFACDRSGNLKVNMNVCAKQLDFNSTETNDTGITTYNLQHQGFCYDFIDSISIIKQYFSGKQQVFISDSLMLGPRNFRLENKTDNNCQLTIKTHELTDTAQIINAKINAIYKNKSLTNAVEFSYQTACKKEIGSVTVKLLDTSACETSAGTGDRFLVSFKHKGYCVTEIDSIGGSGNFYSLDGYFWNSSDFLIPHERIIFHDNTIYQQQIDFKLCVTFNVSDYVSNKIWVIYKDKTRSNKTAFEIYFDHHKKNHKSPKHARESIK